MKKVLKVFIVVFSLFLLIGCENKKAVKKATKQETTTTEEEKKTETYYKEGRNFSENVAWVKPKEDNSNWQLIDTSGKVLFTLEDNEEPTTNFKRGIAIVDNKKVIDKNGNIVSSVEDGEYDKINTNEDTFEGYAFVEKRVSNIEGTNTYHGIIDNDGSWYHKLDSKIGSLQYKAIGTMLYYDSDKCYDLKNNEFIDLETYMNRGFDRSFHDGLIYLTVDEETGYVNLPVDGEDFEVIKNKKKIKKTGYYDKKLNLVIDLSKYPYCNPISYFQDGYCPIILRNPDSEDFYTVLNKKGEFVFEPIEQPGTCHTFSAGLISFFGRESKNNTSYYNINDQKVIDLGDMYPWSADDFYCGLLKVGAGPPTMQLVYYITPDGEIAF
ncbi:hypothetical protein [Anaerostipes sp.]|uniref:hypothetical protein n=1 Tax=Anaerostipes sp. TaxID=1872530 RepID=UPI0025C0872E|nr:hypothetical protein [Anaerostipes sp.]MBS7008287.1 WG repeat-containing protein [Anaerostipes sp.]